MSENIKRKEKTILVYGLSAEELMMLAVSAKRAGIRFKLVSDTQTSLTVSRLLSFEDCPAADPLPLVGKYALLDGFGADLGEASSIINQAAGGVIKAVRTEHNSGWRFADLCFAIQQEQNTLARMKKKK